MSFLKKLKSKIIALLPASLYWDLAGIFNPFSAAIEGLNDKEKFYRSGKHELGLFKKLKIIKKGYKTLEIGCGPGRIQKALVQSRLNLKIYGTDFAPSMIEKAKKNVPKAEFILCSGHDLRQFQNSFFDLVYSFVVFQHVDEKIFNVYLQESNRILKKARFLVFQIQSAGGISNYTRPKKHPWQLRKYTKKEVKDKLEKYGFKDFKIFDMNASPNPKKVDASGFLFLAKKG